MNTLDHSRINAKATGFRRRRPVRMSYDETLRRAVSFIDLTSLEGTDDAARVEHLARTAIRPSPEDEKVPPCAALCVYPTLLRDAKKHLDGSPVRLATVAGGFPSGQAVLPVKVAEVEHAVADGAEEINVVFNRSAFLSGEPERAAEEIRTLRQACGSALLKVILETGELVAFERIRDASMMAIESGADFLKTSTGKSKTGATLSSVLVMLETIKESCENGGRRVGIQPAGGIRTTDDALIYMAMVQDVLGDEWMSPQHIRIGASTLLDHLLSHLKSRSSGPGKLTTRLSATHAA